MAHAAGIAPNCCTGSTAIATGGLDAPPQQRCGDHCWASAARPTGEPCRHLHGGGGGAAAGAGGSGDAGDRWAASGSGPVAGGGLDRFGLPGPLPRHAHRFGAALVPLELPRRRVAQRCAAAAQVSRSADSMMPEAMPASSSAVLSATHSLPALPSERRRSNRCSALQVKFWPASAAPPGRRLQPGALSDQRGCET